MREHAQVSRRQILALGGAILAGGAIIGDSAAEAAVGPGRNPADSPPCVGEPGYDERVARLFEGSGS